MTFAAGIIPYTFFNGNIFFLLGLETSNKKWSGFVGSAERAETPQQTALREFHEESTMAFLQFNDYLINKLQTVSPIIETTRTGKKAYLWFIYLPSDVNLKQFHKNQLTTSEPTLREKKNIQWFSLSQIEHGNVLYQLKRCILQNFS